MAPDGQQSTVDDSGVSPADLDNAASHRETASTLKSGISESTIEGGSPWPTSTEALDRDHPTVDFPRLTCPHCKKFLAASSDAPGKLVCTECGSLFRVDAPEAAARGDGENLLGRFRLLQRVGQGTFG